MKNGSNQIAKQQKDRESQHLQNLIDQVQRDRTDSKNKDLLKRIREKTSMVTAINNEKLRKDEKIRMDKI